MLGAPEGYIMKEHNDDDDDDDYNEDELLSAYSSSAPQRHEAHACEACTRNARGKEGNLVGASTVQRCLSTRLEKIGLHQWQHCTLYTWHVQ